MLRPVVLFETKSEIKPVKTYALIPDKTKDNIFYGVVKSKLTNEELNRTGFLPPLKSYLRIRWSTVCLVNQFNSVLIIQLKLDPFLVIAHCLNALPGFFNHVGPAADVK